MPDLTPLNPDALEAAKNAFDHAMGLDTNDWNQPWEEVAPVKYRDVGVEPAVSAYLAHAQPEVTSVEELDKLPYGSLILDNMEEVGKVRKDTVYFADSGEAHSKAVVAELFLPATVLYTPEGGTE